MTDEVAQDDIAQLVGARRHHVKHLGRAVPAANTIYILHSEICQQSTPDLRDCLFSTALDGGIIPVDWVNALDRTIVLAVDSAGTLCPAAVAMSREMDRPWSADTTDPIINIDPSTYEPNDERRSPQ